MHPRKRMKGVKGYSLIEIMIVISIINILASVAISLYADYSKRARTAEVPLMLKYVVMMVHEWEIDLSIRGLLIAKENCSSIDSNGRCLENFPEFVQDLVADKKGAEITLPFGKFFEFRIKFPTDCGHENLDRFVYAVPVVKSDAPADYQYVCMNDRFDIFHGSEANNPGDGPPGDPPFDPGEKGKGK